MNAPLASNSPAAAPVKPSRHDVYGLIHKGIRTFMLDTLGRLGRADAGAPADVSATLDQVRALLQQLRNHLHHEETFLHSALERRRPGSSVVTSVEHSEHQKAFTELDKLVARCAESSGPELARALKSLYLDLSFFVAENLAHMYREETDTTELLWQLYTDDELRQIEGAIVASETPAELGASMTWMLPAITPQERAGLMGGAKQGLPPEAFAGLMGLAQRALDGVQFRRLQQDLGVG